MNCHLGGAIPCTGGAQKRAGGVAGAKYSGFKKSGFTDDLKTRFKKYEDPAFGAIIDEHILLRIKELQVMKRLKCVDITYFNEVEKLHLEKVLKEVGITDYRLLKCQDFNFSI